MRGVAKTTFSTEVETTSIFTSIWHPAGWIWVTFLCLLVTLVAHKGPAEGVEISSRFHRNFEDPLELPRGTPHPEHMPR